jgi:membrane protein required for colicin V production
MAEFTIADWLIVAIVVISALLSLLRGFAREAISLGAWVAAFFVASMFSPGLQSLLRDVVDNEQARQISSFLILFIATLLVCSMAGYLVSQLLKVTGLGLADRLLGMAFGLVRGVVLALALVLVVDLALEAAGTSPGWYKQSVLMPHLMLMENWARDTTAQLLDWISIPSR